MSRICISGYYGVGNNGDEGVLLAIMDELGWENEYIVISPLPFNMCDSYKKHIPFTEDVRTQFDQRIDYDAYLLGGGNLNWGYGWQQGLQAFASDKQCINYAVEYQKDLFYNPKLQTIYKAFLEHFGAITVRNKHSQDLLREIGVESFLTGCPAINLKERKISVVENMVAVCPRFEDFNVGNNNDQIEWLVNRLQDIKDEVLLIPFCPTDLEGQLRDLEVCKEIVVRLKGARILNIDGYSPREVKYVISRSKKVISGGRYHAVLWAMAHNIPFEVYPQALVNYPKIQGVIEIYQENGVDKMKEMERKNVKIFRENVHG